MVLESGATCSNIRSALLHVADMRSQKWQWHLRMNVIDGIKTSTLSIMLGNLISSFGSPYVSEQKDSRRQSSLANLHEDFVTCQKFQSKGYNVCSVTWEDTGRSKGSCWGPNITDQTLRVDGRPMSVIRKPNFTDETCDVPIDQFTLRVGNETNAPLATMTLKDYLVSKGWYRDRDAQIMVSTQCCVLPVTDGSCKFGIDLYNYQTREDDPSLAVIVSSSEGTSTAPITKRSGQTLFYNKNGRSHAFEAKRLEDDRRERKVQDLPKLELTEEEKQRNVLLVFHVPLKQKERPRTRGGYFGDGCAEMECCNESLTCSYNAAAACAMPLGKGVTRGRGFDAAVLKVSDKDEGEFPGLKDGVTYERDDRFPIRCVIQNYAATDSTEVDDTIIDYVVKRLSTVYTRATAQGSHVVGTGDQGRVTAPTQVASFPVNLPAAPIYAIL